MTLQEQAVLRLVIDGKDARNELAKIGDQIQALKDKQAELTSSDKAEWDKHEKDILRLGATYAKMEQRMDVLKMTTSQLTTYQRELGRELRKLEPDTEGYEAMRKRLVEVNTRLAKLRGEQREVTQEGQTMWQRMREGVATFLAAFTLDRAIQQMQEWGRAAFDAVKNMDRMHVALRNVMASEAEYQQSLKYLNELADLYGQSLGVLTGSYTKFIASSNSTNLSLKERQGIYESIIKAGSALTLSNADIEGSLMAVSQMFSKGNVSAEELRGQLGERLPGAFGIMATALGVNEKQLNKMLEQGQVLAEEALPKFAAALEEMYGAKARANVEQYDGAMNRLTTRLLNWAVTQNESLGITRGMARGINFVTDNLERLVGMVKAAAGGFVAYQVAIRATAAMMTLKNGFLKVQQVLYGQALLAKRAMITATVVETEATVAATTAAQRFNTALKANPWGLAIAAITLLVTAYQGYKLVTEEATRQREDLNNRIADAKAPLEQERLEFEKLTKTVQNNKASLEDRQAALDTLKAKYPEQMKGINDLKDAERLLAKAIRDTNADFVVRAKLMENEERIKYNQERASKVLREQIKLEEDLTTASQKRITMVTGTEGYGRSYLHTFDSEAEKIQKLIDVKKKQFEVYQKSNDKIAEGSEALLEKLKFSYEKDSDNFGKSEGNKTKTHEEEAAKRQNATETALEKLEATQKEHLEKAKKAVEKGMAAQLELMKKAHREELESAESLNESLEGLREARNEYFESSEKLERIRRAKNLAEIEKIEKEYEERAKKRDREKLEDLIKQKKDELAIWRQYGKLTGKEENGLKEELAKLEADHTKMLTEENRERVDDAKETVGKREELNKKAFELQGKYHDASKTARRLFNRDLANLNEQEYKQLETTLERQFEARKKVLESALQFTNKVLDSMKSSMGEDSKVVVDMFKNVIGSIAKGDLIGAGFSILGGVFDLITLKSRQEAERIAKERERERELMQKMWEDAKKRYEDYLTTLGDIGDIYGQIFDPRTIEEKMQNQLDAVQDLWERGKTLARKFGLEAYQELIGGEKEYAALVKKNYEEKVRLEDEYFNKAIGNINARYDLEGQRATQTYDAETQAVLESQSQQLLALINNEESKTSILAEYEAKRSQIMQTFALADRQIVEGMDQGQIEAINAARDARAAALAELQNWYNKELEYIVNSEGQKRKEYSETEKIQNGINDRLKDLANQKKADDIQRELERDAELEMEAARHNKELQRLGEEKDAALAASFERMKAFMIAGYADLQAAAQKAYEQGLITLSQLREVKQLLDEISGMSTTVVQPAPPPLAPRGEGGPAENPPTRTNAPRSSSPGRGFGDGGDIPLRDPSYFENAGVLGGLRHNTPEGGNWVVNPRTGKLLAKVEQGEFIRVYSRAATERYGDHLRMLAASGVANSGMPVYAGGGLMNGSTGRAVFRDMDVPVPGDGRQAKLLAELVDRMERLIEGTAAANGKLDRIARSSAKAADKPPLSVRQVSEQMARANELESRSGFG